MYRSLSATLLFLLPSSVEVLMRGKPTATRFLLALFNSSIAFFLFSFQGQTHTHGERGQGILGSAGVPL
jgi:hypothetical protein